MPSPLVGYNTNVRHRGKVFHIQTEDSGLAHGHIFTHLFADGGRIIATKKTTYVEYIGTDKYPATVKKLMQAQHKAMFIALRDGLFDEDEARGAREFAAREIKIDDEPTTSAPPAAPPASNAPRASDATQVDVEALERAASRYAEASAANVFVDEGPTAPGTVSSPVPSIDQVAPHAKKANSSSGASRSFAKPPANPAPGAAAPKPTPRAKYATTQQAVKRAPARPKPESLFGQDLLSEKSLDEVIMSYLAEDLDTNE